MSARRGTILYFGQLHVIEFGLIEELKQSHEIALSKKCNRHNPLYSDGADTTAVEPSVGYLLRDATIGTFPNTLMRLQHAL